MTQDVGEPTINLQICSYLEVLYRFICLLNPVPNCTVSLSSSWIQGPFCDTEPCQTHKCPSLPSNRYSTLYVHIVATEPVRTQMVCMVSPFTPKFKKEKCIIGVERIVVVLIIVHLSKLWKAEFFILNVIYFWWGCRGKFEIGHFWEWKGWPPIYIHVGHIHLSWSF